MAKRADGSYQPDKRAQLKVKHLRTADCVVAGFREHKSGDGPGSLMLGLYDAEGNLTYTKSGPFENQAELEDAIRQYAINGDSG